MKRGQRRIASGVWAVALNFIPVEDMVGTRPQKSDAILSTGVHVMTPAFNLEPKYRVTTLTREEWTRGRRNSTVVKGLAWFAGGSKTAKGTGAGYMGNPWEEGSVSL